MPDFENDAKYRKTQLKRKINDFDRANYSDVRPVSHTLLQRSERIRSLTTCCGILGEQLASASVQINVTMYREVDVRCRSRVAEPNDVRPTHGNCRRTDPSTTGSATNPD